MAKETQSEDRVEHKASDMERFFTYQEIWYKQYIRPAIKEDVKNQFEECTIPIVNNVRELNKRLLIKTVVVCLILIMIVIFSFK